MHITDLADIKKNFRIIFPKYNNEEIDYINIQGLYGTFYSSFLREYSFLIKMNTLKLPSYFFRILNDMIAFILVLVFGLIIITLDFNNGFTKLATCLTISIFIGAIIDLVIIMFEALSKELNVQDFLS